MDLHAVDAQVVSCAVRILRVDQRQGQKWAAIVRPGGDHRELSKIRLAGHDLRHRSAPHPPQPQAKGSLQQASRSPQRAEPQGGRGPRQLRCTARELERAAPESDLRPPPGSEKIGHQRERAAFYAPEQQGGPPRGNHPSVNLGNLEAWVDRRLDHSEVAVALESPEEGPKVAEFVARQL